MLVVSLVRLNLVLFRHEIEGEVSALAHLRDLLVNKQLQVVVLLVLEIFGQLVNRLLQVIVLLLHVAHLLAEELSLLRKLLLCGQLPRERIVHEGHHQISDILNIVDEHDIAELLLHVVVAALLRQVVLLVALQPGRLPVLRTAEGLGH